MTVKTSDKTVICLHSEDIVATKEGEIGTCKICKQERLYVFNQVPKVLERGYIDGIMTDIHPPGSPVHKVETEPVPEPVTKVKQKPKKPKGRKRFDKYFEDNKESILADYQSMGIKDFLSKWQIASKTWRLLKVKWGVTPKRQSPSALTPIKKPEDGGIPPLPPFNNVWSPQVQIEWLRTIKELNLASQQK